MKSILKHRKLALLLAIALALVVTGIALAAVVSIDTYDVADQNLIADTVTPVDTDFASHVSILGTERDIVATFAAGIRLNVDAGPSGTNKLSFALASSSLGSAIVTYDGVDGNAALDPDGLCSVAACASASGVDLTGTGTNNSFHFEVPFNDNPISLQVRVYSGSSSDYKFYNLALPGSIPAGSHVDFIAPFAAFSDAGLGADFTNVGAIEIYIDGTAEGSTGGDVSLDLLEADDFRDYGDAPATYLQAIHTPDGLRLGNNVDAEAAQNDTGLDDALGDDIDQPPSPPGDEEGVIQTPGFGWNPTNGGRVNVTVNGCTTFPCYLSGWVDWDKSGTFDNPGERIINNVAMNANGTQTRTFVVPLGTTFDTFYFARFRLCKTTFTCNLPTGSVDSGEVEDYKWDFGPNAVTIAGLEARSNVTSWTAIYLAGAGLLVLMALGLLTWRSRRSLR